ncbi:hypothetical protein [Ruania albidiflava]|uniref:hypothetical protein n=1 Tax=Ruania albidiflava TaxID=366586 RepID=UPI0023F46A53|nr:hypothetical protein [Ruania albidiflava]
MAGTTRNRGVAVGVLTLLVLGIVGALWWLLGGRDGADPASGPDTAEPDDAHSAAAALAELTSEPETLLPASLQKAVDLAAAIPDGTEVAADPSSWTESSLGGGVIQVTLTYSDGSTDVLAAVMAQEESHWVVLQTLPWQEAS